MIRYMDLDIAVQYKHDSMGIPGESHILVDNLVALRAFQKHMNKPHVHLVHDIPSLVHKFPIGMGLRLEVVQLLQKKCFRSM